MVAQKIKGIIESYCNHGVIVIMQVRTASGLEQVFVDQRMFEHLYEVVQGAIVGKKIVYNPEAYVIEEVE